jgi:hydroxymethylbilane synthase
MALVQAELVRHALEAAHGELAQIGAVEIVVVKTTGDRVQDRTLAEIGGKGLFTKEIEEALAEDRIDIAVHSVKDVPTWLPEAFALACFLPRDDPRDALVSPKAASFEALGEGAVIGTASLRRQAQILHRWPRLKVVPFRGNAGTRLRKLEEGQADATILGVAGLERIGRMDAARKLLAPEEMLPAVGQGAIGIELRAADERVRRWLDAINHRPTGDCIAAERAMLAVLDGSCRTPIGGLAELDRAGITLRGLVAMPDGSELHQAALSGPRADAIRIGQELGNTLKGMAGRAFFSAMG